MFNTPKTKVTGFFSPVKEIAKKAKTAVVEATSDIISAPARISADLKNKQATRDVAALKNARQYKGAADFDSAGMPTDALKARTMADEVKMRLKKK